VGNPRQGESSPEIELVILIAFSKGARTGEEEGARESYGVEAQSDPPVADYDSDPEGDHDKEFTHVDLELRRCCNLLSCRSALQPTQHTPHRQTRGSPSRVRPNPHMCQRLPIYPLVSANQETATIYLTDFVESEVFNDHKGKMHMDVPTLVFGKCVEMIDGMMAGRGHGTQEVIQMDDLEEQMLRLVQGMPNRPFGSKVGKENVGFGRFWWRR